MSLKISSKWVVGRSCPLWGQPVKTAITNYVQKIRMPTQRTGSTHNPLGNYHEQKGVFVFTLAFTGLYRGNQHRNFLQWLNLLRLVKNISTVLQVTEPTPVVDRQRTNTTLVSSRCQLKMPISQLPVSKSETPSLRFLNKIPIIVLISSSPAHN